MDTDSDKDVDMLKEAAGRPNKLPHKEAWPRVIAGPDESQRFLEQNVTLTSQTHTYFIGSLIRFNIAVSKFIIHKSMLNTVYKKGLTKNTIKKS